MALECRAHTRPAPAEEHREGYAAMSMRAAAVRTEGQGAKPGGAALGADLGGSSEY